MNEQEFQKAIQNPLLTRTGEFDLRLDYLESRTTRLEDQLEDVHTDVMAGLGQLQKDVANLSGRVTGAMFAGGLLGAVVAFIAQLVLRAR